MHRFIDQYVHRLVGNRHSDKATGGSVCDERGGDHDGGSGEDHARQNKAEGQAEAEKRGRASFRWKNIAISTKG